MLNTKANLFTLLLIPLEQGRFERLDTNVTGLGEAVGDKAGKEGAKTSSGGIKSSEILQQRMKKKIEAKKGKTK